MKTYTSVGFLTLALSTVLIGSAGAGESKGLATSDAVAQWEAGRRHEAGLGVRVSLRKAARCYLKAAEQGLAAAQFRVARLYGDGEGRRQSDVLALAWYRKAAAQGHTRAMNRVGVHYMNGWGVTRDLVEARKWFEKAAGDGDVGALANLKATEGKLLAGGVQGGLARAD